MAINANVWALYFPLKPCYTAPMLKWLKKWILPTGIARLFWAFLMFSFFAFAVISACHFIDSHSTVQATLEVNHCCTEERSELKGTPEHTAVVGQISLPGNPPVALSIAVAFILLFFAWPVRDKQKHVQFLLRDRMLRWVWARSLPFSSSDGIFLPYFFATRGA